MKYYKQTDGGYILSISTGTGEREIGGAEYGSILAVIRAKPAGTETADHRLREDLTWEEYAVDPPDPEAEIGGGELLEILMGGAV